MELEIFLFGIDMDKSAMSCLLVSKDLYVKYSLIQSGGFICNFVKDTIIGLPAVQVRNFDDACCAASSHKRQFLNELSRGGIWGWDFKANLFLLQCVFLVFGMLNCFFLKDDLI